MSKQNVYDNEVFFEGYKGIRARENNANILFEIPALFSLMPDLTGKEVLDLGCGYGEHCKAFVERGASKVVGIDISTKMLEVANRDNNDPAITYINMPMEDIDQLNMKFDAVVSSLAIHYVEDYRGLLKNIHDILRPDGVLIFSQEHPFTTTYGNCDFGRWTKDDSGNKLYANLANYGLEGERESEWFISGVKKYHRTFSTILNGLTDEGFEFEKIIEPTPDQELLKKYPEHSDLFHRPDFLLVRASKRS